MTALRLPRLLLLTTLSALAPLSLLSLLSAPAAADTIYLTNGSAIEDVQVGKETFQEIEYREGGKKQKVATDTVLRVEYKQKPALVDRADTAVAEEQVFDGIADFETYLSGFLAGGKRERFDWAPAYAAWRLVELYRMVGELEKAASSAQRLIDNFGDSRFLPRAYLAMAEVHSDLGQADKAQSILKALEAEVQKQGLSRRWALEGQLAQVLYDPSLKGSAKRDKLVQISSSAGREFPTVRNRADVAEAESFLDQKQVAEAEKIFQRIVDDPKADTRTLAAAYTGLGDCLFQRAVKLDVTGAEAQKMLKAALLSFMRVVVVYKDQVRYVPKAMFYAGRIFDLQEDEAAKANAQKLYLAVLRTYDGTSWADEARGFRTR